MNRKGEETPVAGEEHFCVQGGCCYYHKKDLNNFQMMGKPVHKKKYFKNLGERDSVLELEQQCEVGRGAKFKKKKT